MKRETLNAYKTGLQVSAITALAFIIRPAWTGPRATMRLMHILRTLQSVAYLSCVPRLLGDFLGGLEDADTPEVYHARIRRLFKELEDVLQ